MGFTLIELLVTVAIVAVLASLLLPALNRAKSLAKDIQCRSRLKQTALASQMYVMDHERFTSGIRWENRLDVYLNSEKVYRFPGCKHRFNHLLFECTGPFKYFEIAQLSYIHPTSGRGKCQMKAAKIPRRLGFNSEGGRMAGHDGYGQADLSKDRYEFGMTDTNGKRVGVVDANGDFHWRGYGLQHKTLARVRSPSECIQFGDTGTWKGSSGFNMSLIGYAFNKDKRHGNKSNMAFVDGHIESAIQDSWFARTPEARRKWHIDNKPHPEMWEREINSEENWMSP